MNAMRTVLGWCCALWMALSGAMAHAQNYPARPLRIIVPYPPGASTDYTARLMGQRITEALGQSVVVENRGGAGGIIAAELAARAAPDGYTLFFGTPAALCIAPAIQAKVPYDTNRDYAFINRLVVNPQIMVALPGFPASTVAEVVQLARAKPGQYTYASVGQGSPQHLGMELLKFRAKLDIVHVPYKGGGPAMTDVLAGRVQLYMASMPALIPLVKAGKLKVLGIGGAERTAVFPGVATIAESVPGYEFVGTWYGLLTQARVAPAIVERLNGVITAALQTDEVRQLLTAQGSDPKPMTVAEFGKFVRSDCEGWARAVRAAGLKAE